MFSTLCVLDAHQTLAFVSAASSISFGALVTLALPCQLSLSPRYVSPDKENNNVELFPSEILLESLRVRKQIPLDVDKR